MLRLYYTTAICQTTHLKIPCFFRLFAADTTTTNLQLQNRLHFRRKNVIEVDN